MHPPQMIQQPRSPQYHLPQQNVAQQHPQPIIPHPPQMEEQPTVQLQQPQHLIPYPAGGVRRSQRDRQQPDRLGAKAYNENQPLVGEDAMVAAWGPGYTQGTWNQNTPR